MPIAYRRHLLASATVLHGELGPAEKKRASTMTFPATCHHFAHRAALRPALRALPSPRVDDIQIAVVDIAGLPRSRRMAVEELFYTHLRSEPAVPASATVDYEANWCTQWQSDPRSRTVSCSQLLSGTATELDTLATALTELGESLSAQVSTSVRIVSA
ncbi:hypothetical protein [Corynebacterium sp. TAE3-ERU30]|uniref:hypothetical protein n=1 Tax=Corynebacterium sp. TAE3-ERU30 TaxID=2849496 RepID=UPI001C473B38|nr:hypothetical protein [Corynebacterium sp. TAE3-ERU30]MBV7281745.1 hypothetical protein [Corynebacterium sp. TAE3-ERU30]